MRSLTPSFFYHQRKHKVQDMYKYPYPATIWNHAAAHILHVHILHPESCKKKERKKESQTLSLSLPLSTSKSTLRLGDNSSSLKKKLTIASTEAISTTSRASAGWTSTSVESNSGSVLIPSQTCVQRVRYGYGTACKLLSLVLQTLVNARIVFDPVTTNSAASASSRIDQSDDAESESQDRRLKRPTCDSAVSHVSGFLHQ